jgi:hypothetical protein
MGMRTYIKVCFFADSQSKATGDHREIGKNINDQWLFGWDNYINLKVYYGKRKNTSDRRLRTNWC